MISRAGGVGGFDISIDVCARSPTSLYNGGVV